MFRSYPSISNKASWVAAEAATLPGEVWVATPKIHGCNVSVLVQACDGSVAHCRRNDKLLPTDSFYRHNEVLPPDDVWRRLLALFPAAAQVAVFGELYGGGYPPCDGVARNPKALVQRGVWYGPDNYFVAFDVRVDDTFLDFYDAMAVCAQVGVPTMPWCFRGPFDAAVAWAADHAAAPAWPLGQPPVGPRPARVVAGEAHFAPATFAQLPLVPDNAGEGWVVRPVHERVHGRTGDRLMLKVKNPHFAETPPAAATAAPASAPVPLVGGEEYLTPARAAAVASKLPQQQVTLSNLANLAGLLQADALQDMPMDHPLPVAIATLGSKCPAAKAFLAKCFVAMKQHCVSAC